MDYNYDRNIGRRRANNQAAVTPYSRPQENRYMPSSGRPMVTTQNRHDRENIPNRYGNVLDDVPQQNACLSAMPQTPARTTFTRPRFQTPFASAIACPDSPQMPGSRIPYSTGGDMDDMMMPIGSPATPQPRYAHERYEPRYETPGRFNTPASRCGRRPLEHVIYDHYTELNEPPPSSEPHDYNRQVLQTSPPEFSAPFSKNTSPRGYGSFLKGAHQFPSPVMQSNQYDEPIGLVNSYMKPAPLLVANTRQYLNEPMEETVEEGNFARLSIDKDPNEKNSRPLASAGRSVSQQKSAPPPPPGPVVMSKKVQESAPALTKDTSDKHFVMSGPIEKILKWGAVLKDNPMILYETIAPLVQVRDGERPDEKIVLLRGAATPVLQCVFSEMDRRIPYLRPGQLVRCVGKMVSPAKMRGFSVRGASDAEMKCIVRMNFIVNRVVNDMTREKKPEPEPMRE